MRRQSEHCGTPQLSSTCLLIAVPKSVLQLGNHRLNYLSFRLTQGEPDPYSILCRKIIRRALEGGSSRNETCNLQDVGCAFPADGRALRHK